MVPMDVRTTVNTCIVCSLKCSQKTELNFGDDFFLVAALAI